MTLGRLVLSGLAVVLGAATSFGHGNPLNVGVTAGQLTVSGGLALASGFAELAADPHEDAAFDFGPNQTLRSTFPGYNLAGIASDAALHFEILSRPDFGTPGHPTRWLWFWDPTSQAVAQPAGDQAFRVLPLFGSGDIEVRPSALDLGPTLVMADPIGPFLGADQHLLIYELDNSPAAEPGVYGIFARLTSPGLNASKPFLLAFRHGVLPETFSIAAEAINFAAGLPGDFNLDGTVDAADYTVWRDGLSAAYTQVDYFTWQAHFGQSAGGSNLATAATSAVPEPTALALIVFTFPSVLIGRVPGRTIRI